uniref:Uncharacterized protein n=1 Tax=Octopus bimaculoides TaxID=37653 RepID=A0A0L8FND0_OCTBM
MHVPAFESITTILNTKLSQAPSLLHFLKHSPSCKPGGPLVHLTSHNKSCRACVNSAVF